MAKPVRIHRAQPGAFRRGRHRLGHPTRADPAVRGPDPDEQPAIQRLRRSPPLQIVNDRPPDITRQRHPIKSTALPGDGEFAAAPIDVVQTQARDLAAAQPDPRQQSQHRVVAQTRRSSPIAR